VSGDLSGGSGRGKMKAFKSEVIEVIGELIDELESVSVGLYKLNAVDP
jgi:hypothetical protein